ncbi:MAG TPA: deoxyribose-phosphate aldolase [Enterovirga sp.]
MTDANVAGRALACLDLTDLSELTSDQATDELCRKARAAGVAAVCVWPQMVSRARSQLDGPGIALATVINFPAGGEDVERAVEDTEEALSDGATEIDLVMPYRAFLAGRHEVAREMVAAVRDIVDGGRRLKVILETGELGDAAAVAAASRFAIEAGADFLRTSTGKSPVSATPEAAEAMLGVIKQAGRAVGLKASGGIRTLDEARLYLEIADRIMGPGWAKPATFRIGASGLYDELVAARGANTP